MKIVLAISILTLHLFAGLFNSVEEDVYNLLKQKKYKEALFLIEKKDNFDANYKHMINLSDNYDVAKALIKKGAKLNWKVKRKVFIIKTLRLRGDEKYYDNTPLFYIRDAKVLKLLIDNKANVNAKGQYNETPIMSVRNLAALKLFIENGSDVNARTKYGNTALSSIIDRGSRKKEIYTEQLKMILALLIKGAKPNIQDNGGHVPLHSIRWDQVEIAKLLVGFNADITIKTPEGNSPLCYAIADNNMKLIYFYFQSGANFDWTCEDDLKLIDYSIKKNTKIGRSTKLLVELKKSMSK